MSLLKEAARRRRAEREMYRRSIQYAITHAISPRDRNELIAMATAQGLAV
jgi:hypothetical protein